MWKPTADLLQCDLDYDLASISNFPQSCSTRVLLSALNGLCGDTEKMLTRAHIHTSGPHTHVHTVTTKDRFLANNSPNVTFPLCSVAMAAINCAEVFMCRTNSAKELIVLAHSTQSYRLCTLTPAHSLSNPLLFESGVKTAWNSGKNHHSWKTFNSELQGKAYQHYRQM